jgi:hypothetical protein
VRCPRLVSKLLVLFPLFKMSVDSLNDELDEQFDRAFGSLEKWSPQPLPIRALKKSRDAISTVASELSNDSTKVVDYQGFVRFMSTCPAPIVDAKNVEIQAFIGSGWTMSVFRGGWKTPDKVRAVAVKYVNYVSSLPTLCQRVLGSLTWDSPSGYPHKRSLLKTFI